MRHKEQGHGGALLLGQWNPEGIWYYFPVALALKSALLLLLAAAVVAVARPRALANAVCLAASLLLLYSLNCRVQIGVRLFLPVVTLLAIATSAALGQWSQQPGSAWGRRLLGAGAACA